MDKVTYHEKESRENIVRLREVLKTLPAFCSHYFRAIEPKTTAKTRISYAYDIRLFFLFLHKKWEKEFSEMDIRDLDSVTPLLIEEYLESLKLYEDKQGVIRANHERGLKRKLASLRSFYHYYHKHEMIEKNPTQIVDMPKLRKQEIIRLDIDEVANLLDYVEHGGKQLSGMKKVYFEKNQTRNLALLTLLLGTGVRVSECVGLDLEDIDFRNSRIRVIRKGNKEDFVYFGDEVAESLNNYLKDREKITPKEGHEHALFLSIQKKRISVHAIENLVSDLATHVTSVKHITPHKLRSTYGTSLYRETGDIYLVAEVLGHNDVNTTRKHYAALDEDRKRMAASAVNLREK